MKRPFIYFDKQGDFTFLWIWKVSLIWITNAKHETDKFFEIWRAKYGKAFIFGKHGLGIGNSFSF